MNTIKLSSYVKRFWAESAVPILSEFIKIPAKNSAFDTEWKSNKHLWHAVNLIEKWIKQQLPNSITKVITLKGRSPFLYVEVSGSSSSANKTVVFYGHLDKTPESEGWSKKRGPWKPVLEKDKLYGRGASDNGSAPFIAVSALKALADQSISYARCVFLLECSEENGSPDFLSYLKALKKEIGTPDLIICLDSGGDDFERLWITNSIRGSITAILNVALLKRAVHSGSFGGLVASTFRIMRQLLARVENVATGELLISDAKVKISSEWKRALQVAAKAIGDKMHKSIPLLPRCALTSSSTLELLQRQTWGASMEVVGARGLPAIKHASNVIRPSTALQLNIRIPPIANVAKVAASLKRILEKNPPCGAKVNFITKAKTSGWVISKMPPWLKKTLKDVAKLYFKGKIIYRGEGGAINPITILSQQFSQAQFVVMGTNCIDANIHGPDEFLHLPTARKLSCVVAHILAEHFRNKSGVLK